MNTKVAVVWFRQDLRLHDNEALTKAMERAQEVVPVYVFDERHFQKTTFGFEKTGNHRAKFLLESVDDLRKSFQGLDIDLVVRIGKPEEEIPKLVQDLEAGWVFCNMERMPEEVHVQNNLEQRLWRMGRELYCYRGKMLYYTQDLPFPVVHTPDNFTTFRKEVEQITPIRNPLPSPKKFQKWRLPIDAGKLPTLQELGYEIPKQDPRTAFPFCGGETSGLQRLKYYLWDTDLIQHYKQTRNGMLGVDYSSKLSPWLADGCLSPKQVYYEMKQYQQERTKNDATYWLFFELLWRDYFRLIGKKYTVKIFQKGGIAQKTNKQLTNNWKLFNLWREGKTGVPLIDANMRELATTGFISNRGRQNVACFLVKNLGVNWQMGAEYFESKLIDYDVCSNYCNWNYIVGIGNDPREDRYFNPITQARNYDPDGSYIKCWLPELKNIPTDKLYQPYLLTSAEQAAYGVKIGLDYPDLCVSLQNTYK